MNKKLALIGSGVAATLSVSLVFSAAALAASHGDQKYVQDSSGMGLRDSAGDCVISISGAAVADCMEAEIVAAPPAPAAPAVTGISLGAETLFDFDRSDLRPEGRAELSNLVSQMSGADVQSVDIVGHTDSIGSEAYNQALSERRAQSAADYLVGQGVSPGVISTRGAGELQPVAPNTNPDGSDNPDGRQQNRRVDITVVAETTN